LSSEEGLQFHHTQNPISEGHGIIIGLLNLQKMAQKRGGAWSGGCLKRQA
jgi:hypothetical protein